MKNKIFLFFTLSLLSISIASAQSIKVSGVVTDETGAPLAGVTVAVKGSSVGTSTDIDGKYSINTDKSKVLTFSFLGYTGQEHIARLATLNVSLEPDDYMLDEITVAYRTVSRAGYTGSASVLNKEAISNSQVSDISRALQGVSGIQSVAPSGQPGSEAQIFIRGIGSINASSNPLYVVDGAPFQGDLNSISPSDIESISVLKDAASSALYGSRAANGVIIITTKQGKKNSKAKVEARVSYGISGRAVADYEQVSTNQYFEMYWQALRNNEVYINKKSPTEAAQIATNNITGNLGINPYGTKFANPVGLDGKIVAGATPLWNDDWSKEYTQNANRLEAVASIAGGGDKSTYFASLAYLDDQGIAINSGFKRYTGRLNLNVDISPRVKLTTGITLIHSLQDSPQGEDSNLANTLNFARMMPGFYPIWERDRTDGSFILDTNGNRIFDFGPYRPSGANPRYNHLATAPYDFAQRKRDMASIRLALDVDIYKGLRYKPSVNIDYTTRNDHDYSNPLVGSAASYGGDVLKRNYRTTEFTINNILSYDMTFENLHRIKLLAGHEYYEFNTTNFYGSRQGFVLDQLYEPAAASTITSFDGTADVYKLLSFLANAEYSYDNKYFGSASIRTDASSRFSPETRWGTFWSLGGSWRLSQEQFIQDIDWLSFLTLRASYGGQGNDKLPTYYAWKGLHRIQNNLGEPGLTTERLGTPNLKWETNLNFNIGLDFKLFNDRFGGTVEFFDRRSKDLLFDLQKAPSIGYTSESVNAGALKNVGIEASLTYTAIKTKDIQWDITVNATHFKNQITALPETAEGFLLSGNKILAVGGSVYDFFLVEWAGINKEGLPQWYKTDSKGNRVITTTYTDANNSQSKIVAGSSLPDLVGGITTNFKFKDFDFSALLAYSIGGKLYNSDKLAIMHNGSTAGRAWSVDMLNYWTPENPNTDIPRLQTSNTNWTSASTRFLVDASYARLKNVTLGYNLPQPLLKKLSLQHFRVFMQAENLLTFFGEQGLDPEQAINGNTYYRYPAMRTLSWGMNLTF